jgi:hypothetical protein
MVLLLLNLDGCCELLNLAGRIMPDAGPNFNRLSKEFSEDVLTLTQAAARMWAIGTISSSR